MWRLCGVYKCIVTKTAKRHMENLGAFMLTFLEITKAQAKDKEYNLADGNGLYLRILPSGIKNWIANFRSDGKKISKKLGSFPELSIKEAREQLSLLKAQAKFEGSPVIKEKVHTFEEIYYEWIEVKKVKVKNWHDISNRIERYILPSLGKIDYKSITPVAFVEILKQDLYTRGKYETIKRICMYIKEIDIYAMNIGYVKELRFQNLYSVFPVKTVIKNRPSVHYSQLPTVLKELQVYGLKARATWEVLLTGFYTLLRPNEYCSLEWSWINFEDNTITVPAEVMKMKLPHVVPITKQMLTLLLNRPRVGKYVFPATQGKVVQHFSTNSASLFLRRHGFKDKLVPHGIRSIGRTWMHDHDIPFDVAEKCLAHTVGTSTQLAYDRSDLLEKRREAMQQWCDFVDHCLKGGADLLL